MATAVASCGGRPRQATIAITPGSSLADAPVDIVIRGLSARERVTLSLSSTDALGNKWSSRAGYQADDQGVVDLARAPARSGSYQGTVEMGLIDAMEPVGAPNDDGGYRWDGAVPQVFVLSVMAGRSVLAKSSFLRSLTAPGVTVEKETLAGTGFFGAYWLPPPGTPPHLGVVEFGGSEGGLDGQLVGAGLASAGYPTLDIAYFGEPGLPTTLSGIPLEYFARALHWLASQPQVDPAKIWVMGSSRGSEAALLLGAYYPRLVHGVVAGSPSDVALCNFPGCNGPAWTFDGKALPFTSQFDEPAPTDDPAAVIPVGRIDGPVFLDCGTDDQVWVSCAYAQADLAHLDASHDPWAHVLYQYSGAGHFVADLTPYEPTSASFRRRNQDGQGGEPLSNDIADAQLWPQLLDFLSQPSRSGIIFANA